MDRGIVPRGAEPQPTGRSSITNAVLRGPRCCSTWLLPSYRLGQGSAAEIGAGAGSGQGPASDAQVDASRPPPLRRALPPALHLLSLVMAELEKAEGRSRHSPCRIERVTPGEHRVNVSAAGYQPPTSGSLMVEAGTTAVVEFQLAHE